MFTNHLIKCEFPWKNIDHVSMKLLIVKQVNSDILEISEGEEVVMKILEMLRILKYTPPANIEP